jgi:hypothetical protein
MRDKQRVPEMARDFVAASRAFANAKMSTPARYASALSMMRAADENATRRSFMSDAATAQR